jgi:hypothetical protein
LGEYFTYGSVPHFSLTFARIWTLGKKGGRAIVELTMLSYILIAKIDLVVQMKIPSFRIKDSNNKAKTDKQFVCREYKMTFQSKDSLELHKRKSRHFTGLVYFGKNDRKG